MLFTDWHLWFVPKVWYCPPAFPEIVRRHFRLAFSCEHSLFITLDAHNTLTGLEIREVPDLLTDKGRELVSWLGKMGGTCSCIPQMRGPTPYQ